MKKVMLSAMVSMFLVTSAPAQNISTETASSGLGAILGGSLGYGLAKDSSNKELWVVLGLITGALVGNSVGQRLDERDRLLAGQSMQSSLEYQPDRVATGWNNPNTGNSGTVMPTATVITNQGVPCREFVQQIVVGGETVQAYGTACRQADGSWRIVSN